MSDTPRTDARWEEEWANKAKHKEASPAHGMFDLAAQLERELAAAQARLKEVEADAGRYKWVRSQKHIDIAACWLVAAKVPVPETPEELDAAIDAARAEGK